MFPCLQGEKFWPLTASVGFFRAPVENVTNSVVAWGRRSPWVRSEHHTLDDALRALAPLGSVRIVFFLPSGNGAWTTVLRTDFLTGDFARHLAVRAYYDLGCEFVGCCWQPATPFWDGGATFAHERAIPRMRRRFGRQSPAGKEDLRSVETGDVGGYFYARGELRPFEEPQYYERRRTVDRLPRELLARYAGAAGVAVDDPEWWDGPVTVAAETNRTPLPHEQPVDPSDMWSTIDDLRRLCQYPLDRIPDDLAPPKRGARGPKKGDMLDARGRLLARIGNINDFTRPRPLVTLHEFFEGNDDPGSIGYNLPSGPLPGDFYDLLSAIAARQEVADVRIEVKDLEDPDGWPSTDTIWIFTAAGVDTVRAWFPDDLAPDELTPSDALDDSIEAYEVPAGTRAIAAWYD